MPQPQLCLGTSGFSFEDWRGPVYPERLPVSRWLAYYEQQLGFNALEINYTYYQMPAPRTLQGMVRKTSQAFRFAVKAHRSLTHDMLQRDGTIVDHPLAFQEFRRGIAPLHASGQLACVLAQFPYAFTRTPEHQAYLTAVMDRLCDMPLVVEFRHHSWVDPEVFRTLRARQIGWCAVDEPQLPRLMPWVPEVTADLGYVRFHGRNAAQWFGTSTAERYNYSYSEIELTELARRLGGLRDRAPALLIFFNNCHAGSAAKNAIRFRELLVQDGWHAPGRRAAEPSLFDPPTR